MRAIYKYYEFSKQVEHFFINVQHRAPLLPQIRMC